MTVRQEPSLSPARGRSRGRGRAASRRLVAYGAAFLLTMAMFSAAPSGRTPAGTAVVRVVDRPKDGRFRSGEVIGGSLVLTVPLGASAGGGATRSAHGSSPA